MAGRRYGEVVADCHGGIVDCRESRLHDTQRCYTFLNISWEQYRHILKALQPRGRHGYVMLCKHAVILFNNSYCWSKLFDLFQSFIDLIELKYCQW